METSLSLKDAVGLAADLMTLFGLSGFFTWAFVRKSLEGKRAEDVGISIFALAVKAFISVFLVGMLLVPAWFLQMMVIIFIHGSYASSDSFWNDQKATAFVVGYFVNALWLIPMAVLTLASIFSWSFEPFARFLRQFTGKANAAGRDG